MEVSVSFGNDPRTWISFQPRISFTSFFGYFDAMAAVETKPGGICGKLSDGKNEFILVYWAWLGLKLLGLN